MQYQLANGLKKLRAQRGWSLDKAAGKTGVSKAMLGQIERDESSPTLNTLWKIARGYELSFSQLLALLSPEETTLGEQGFEPTGSALAVRTLIPYDSAMRAELLELTMRPAFRRESEPHESGVVEHAILIRGHASILTEKGWHELAQGEAYRFQADICHGYRNDSAIESALIHNLIYYPNGRADG